MKSDDYGLTAAQLSEKYNSNTCDDRDGEYPGYPQWDWRQAVAQRVTIDSYWLWVASKLEQEYETALRAEAQIPKAHPVEKFAANTWRNPK